ncbi:hypothetical protein QQX98_000956 [Neonectria punicea]|uniref:Uncharacterized protein n=1 Tax=Neonectria punicea TaxID=979145 RepID=A0ABR1HRQ2_9HYPO
MRGGAADNVYVIPAPDRLTFGTATLLASACCVHAILCLVSMWDKIVEINWKQRYSRRNNENEQYDAVIDGTNGATPAMMKGINGRIQYFLRVIAIPIFGGAGLAILIIGEMNFFSRQVRYQTEPIASVGQWTPIAGTVMAVVGSLYLLLAADMETAKGQATPDIRNQQCNCSHQDHYQASLAEPQMRPRSCSASSHISGSTHSNSRDYTHIETKSDTTKKRDAGYRQKVAKTLIAVGEWLGSPTNDFDDAGIKHGKAAEYPQVPGEGGRNRLLPMIVKRYGGDRSSLELQEPRGPGLTPSNTLQVPSPTHHSSTRASRSMSPAARARVPDDFQAVIDGNEWTPRRLSTNTQSRRTEPLMTPALDVSGRSSSTESRD